MGLSLLSLICFLHSVITTTTSFLMMFYISDIYSLTHGAVVATKLIGSMTRDQLLIWMSDSFSGLLLFAIGFLVFMVAFVKDKDFHSFFAKGCVLLHASMAVWRFNFERRVKDLAWDWLRLLVGDVALTLSWIFFLVYLWKDKYD